jgi:thiol-disulfide isomerase/thioredoxin
LICPNCRQFTPDQGFRCISCNSILNKKEQYPGPEQTARLRSDEHSFFKPWMLLPMVLLAILAYVFLAQRNKSHAVNAHAPGAELTITGYLKAGKTNIVDFYSDYCPPCRKISPLLQELGRKRPDLAILQVDINRKGIKAIDWSSPLARQYELNSVPSFRIYDGEGNLLKEGQEAYVEVILMMAQTGIRM